MVPEPGWFLSGCTGYGRWATWNSRALGASAAGRCGGSPWGARPLGGGDRRALLGGARSARELFAAASFASSSSRCRSLVVACDGRVRGAAPPRQFLAGMVFEVRDLGMMGGASEFRGALHGGPAGSGLERAQT